MRGAGDIVGFQAEEVVRAYGKAREAGELTLAKNIRANHTDLESRFAKVDAEQDQPVGA
jgi:hypothetical protein